MAFLPWCLNAICVHIAAARGNHNAKKR